VQTPSLRSLRIEGTGKACTDLLLYIFAPPDKVWLQGLYMTGKSSLVLRFAWQSLVAGPLYDRKE